MFIFLVIEKLICRFTMDYNVCHGVLFIIVIIIIIINISK